MNRRDLTTPGAGSDDERRSGSPSDESRRFEKPEPGIPEGSRERLSKPEVSQPVERTRVVLLPIDPFLVHAYWRVSPQDLEEAYTRLGENAERAQAALKFYDVTHIIFDGTNAHSSFEVNVKVEARNWYVHLWSPGKSYCVDLGFITEGGGFLTLARSNVVSVPPAGPSTRIEERYTDVEGRPQRAEPVVRPTEPRHERLVSARPSIASIPPAAPSKRGEEFGTFAKGGPQPAEPAPPLREHRHEPPKSAWNRGEQGRQKSSTWHDTAGLIDGWKRWLRKLAGAYGYRIWMRPQSDPTPPRPDLTEACERKFVSGLFSSRWAKTQEAKNEVGDRGR